MLEHVPEWLGKMLQGRRAGHDRIVAADLTVGLGGQPLDLSSPAFADGGRLPVRFTADGDGVSPPLVWSGVPEGAASLALIAEDPDAPFAQPLVHAIVWDIPGGDNAIAEGAIVPDGSAAPGDIGRNSFLRSGWLPPDPPTGHGEHDYIFQLFALSSRPELGPNPGRTAFVEAIAGNVVAAGILVGTYSRGNQAVASPDAGHAPIGSVAID